MRFRKDLGMDSTFPPEIMPPTPGSVIPVGHLRPLGKINYFTKVANRKVLETHHIL